MRWHEKKGVLWKIWYHSNTSRTWPSNLTFSVQHLLVNGSDKTWEDSLLIHSMKSSVVRVFRLIVFWTHKLCFLCLNRFRHPIHSRAPPFLVNLSTWIQTVWNLSSSDVMVPNTDSLELRGKTTISESGKTVFFDREQTDVCSRFLVNFFDL